MEQKVRCRHVVMAAVIVPRSKIILMWKPAMQQGRRTRQMGLRLLESRVLGRCVEHEHASIRRARPRSGWGPPSVVGMVDFVCVDNW